MHNNPIALITGANRGLGKEIARQLGKQGYTVVLGSRDNAKGEAAAQELREDGIDAHAIELDVEDAKEIAAAPKWIEEKFGRLDVLVNNAGILADGNTSPEDLDEAKLRETFEANFFGPFNMHKACLPLLKKAPAPRIVNMSSTLGSLTAVSDPNSRFSTSAPAYQASKTALNALTVAFARELRDTSAKVNSCCPGWVRTDMGGKNAAKSVEEGADTPVWLATLPEDGPTGGFFRERERIDW